VLVASVIPRAIETAEIIAPGLGFDRVERDCDLCEVHTGEADGLPWAEYPSRYGALDMTAEPDRVFAPGGESWNGFHERVERTMRRLAAEHRGSAVVAVCHAGVIQASLRTLLGIAHPGTGDPGTGARIQPANTGLTVWEHDDLDDRWTLHTFNQATHLAALARHDATGNRR
jgi:broad specificity phosphatase PhoE